MSFFSFQAVTYVVDTYRRQTEPASLLDAAIYLSFFPHLVAGPIVRASEFLPQLRAPRDPKRVAVGAGLTLVGLGLVKKVLIADYLAREVVDPVFAVPQAYAAPDAFLGAYAYAAQIYCDFSGYTDMAIGLALLLGFVFPQNFNSPYRATGFRDFWRRWHMTLSRFLRDYLYIPLGGNRKGRVRTYVNLMLTMTLGGLWHGASWNFVAWGAYQGAGLSTEHALNGRLGWLPGWFRWFCVFNAVVFGWILFRTQDMTLFGDYVSALFRSGEATLYSVPGGRGDRGRGRRPAAARAADRGPRAPPRPPQPDPARRRARRGRADRRRDRAEPGRAPVHLLPLLMAPPPKEEFETLTEMEAEARPGREGEPHGDDSLMGRYERWGLNRFSARDAVIATTLTALLLLVFAGGAVREAADELDPGLGRDIVKAIGGPTGWVSDQLPLAAERADALSWLSPDEELGREDSPRAGGAAAGQARAPAEGTEPLRRCSSPATRSRPRSTSRSRATRRRRLGVAGDPRSAPGDRRLQRDRRLGSALGGPGGAEDPDAVVMFIGANEGYPMTTAGRRPGAVLRPRLGGGVPGAGGEDDGQLPRRGRHAASTG